LIGTDAESQRHPNRDVSEPGDAPAPPGHGIGPFSIGRQRKREFADTPQADEWFAKMAITQVSGPGSATCQHAINVERRHKHDKLFKLNLRNSGSEVTLLLEVKEFTNVKHVFGRS